MARLLMCELARVPTIKLKVAWGDSRLKANIEKPRKNGAPICDAMLTRHECWA